MSNFNAKLGLSVGTPAVNVIDNSGNATLGTVSGSTITAATQFSGPGTGLTGTATSLTVGNATQLGGSPAASYALTSAIPVASSTTPVMDGVAAIGSGTTWAKADHVHPSDTAKAAVGQTFYLGSTSVAINRTTGAIALTGITSIDGNAATVTTNANLTGGVTSVGNAATVVTNANLTGDVTSVGNATSLTATVVTGKALTGLSTATGGTIAVTDSILSALGKLENRTALNDAKTVPVASSTTPVMDGTAAIGSGTTWAKADHVHPSDTAKAAVGQVHYVGTTSIAANRASLAMTLTGVSIDGSSASCTGNAVTVTTNANLTGEVTSSGNVTTVTNAAVIGKVLTGISTATGGTVAATDSILAAFGRLENRTALNDAKVTYPGLATATSSVLGGVKPDGTSILNTAGVISATAASVGAVATSAYTAADVLAKLLTVDGAGSLLDADSLDGQAGSYYAAASAVPALAIASTLTGFTAGAGTVTSADTILSALQKHEYMIANSVATNATNSTNIAITDDLASTVLYPTLVSATSGNNGVKTSSTKLTFNASTGALTATKVYNAVYNDIADFLEIEEALDVIEMGKVYVRTVDGLTRLSNSVAEKGALGITSDTYGYGLGKKDIGNRELPLAIGGFVLAYCDREYESGDELTCGPNGILTLMPANAKASALLATFHKTPQGNLWNGVEVKGRYLVKVK